jgi:hypothetical protein
MRAVERLAGAKIRSVEENRLPPKSAVGKITKEGFKPRMFVFGTGKLRWFSITLVNGEQLFRRRTF